MAIMSTRVSKVPINMFDHKYRQIIFKKYMHASYRMYASLQVQDQTKLTATFHECHMLDAFLHY